MTSKTLVEKKVMVFDPGNGIEMFSNEIINHNRWVEFARNPTNFYGDLSMEFYNNLHENTNIYTVMGSLIDYSQAKICEICSLLMSMIR